jgi:glycosyltransferase involved in cell wall biosynthesis
MLNRYSLHLKKKSTIALCIPAYKAEGYIERLLESARIQDPPFDQIIVCVDASPDNTADVARSFGATVIVNDSNLGCSASKNLALAAATTEWVHFHDADDLLLPGFTTEAMKWMMLNDSPDAVIMGFEYRNYATNDLLATGLVNDAELATDPVLFSICKKLPNFGIYRRVSLLNVGGFDCDPSVLYNEDVAFHTKLALAGLRFRASNIVTSVNWLHGDSMSQNNQIKCLKAHCRVMFKVANVVGHKYPKEIATRFWTAATGLAAFQDWDAVDSAIDQARRLYKGMPTDISKTFFVLCRILGPHVAFRVRERAIRLFKPRLRQ